MRLLVAAAAVLLLAAPATAGSVDDPEITDPADDHKMTGGQDDPDDLVKSVDLIKGWVEAVTDEHVELRVQTSQQMRGGQVSGNPTTQYDYDYSFTLNGATYMAAATVAGPAPPSVTARGVASEASIHPDSDSTLVLIVPLESIGLPAPGDVFSEMSVAARVYANQVTMATDRAPDSGAGRDFVMPEPSGAGGIVFLNGSTFPVTIEQTFTEPTTATYQLNWTSPGGNLSSVVLVNATEGTVDIEYRVGNESVHRSNASAEAALADVPAGNGTITINYTAFAGQVAIDIAPATEPGATGTQGPGTQGPGTGTSEPGANETGEPGGNDTPVPFIVPALGLALAAAVRRRL